ncbi:hypothetical protein LX99_03899 [Mucilaginibacter oryzae]|uniref:Uncharacterized protein n=1 Tax=Mucilaginibacter oryzae TaxID=468058 RepID=A0A316HAN8_9SPHI|nr:hypothetical protein [Mucilaginibacter oryzae]PWK75405.1 hypothetical protein LX99_03899 [Mucilaginibacter oryzae]
MDLHITNISDLQAEIFRLKALEKEQAIALKARVNSPSAVFSTVLTLFPRSNDTDGIKGTSIFHPDMLNLISRFIIPLALNKTLFKHSNFLVKTLVGLVSQKASNYVSEETVTGVWDKAKALFAKFVKKKEEKTYKPAPYVKPAGGAVV